MKKNKIKVGDIVLCIGAGRPQEVVAIKRHLFSTNYMVRDHGYNSRYLKEAQLKEITLLYQKPPLHPMQNDRHDILTLKVVVAFLVLLLM